MFTTNTFQWPDRPIARSSVPVGAAFRYPDGNGNIYCHLGAYMDLYMSMKMFNYSTNVASITCTPVGSPTTRKQAEIIGAYNFVLRYEEPARIVSLTNEVAHNFGDIVSFPRDLDEHGNSHIYISLGLNVSGNVREHLFIRVTEKIGSESFKTMPMGTIAAIRGSAFVQLQQKEEV